MANYLDNILSANVDILAVAKEIAPNGKVIGNKEYRSLCPFHQEKTPSYFINLQTGVTHCFGCNHKGDIIRDYCGVKFNALSGELLRRATDEIIERFGKTKKPQTQKDDILQLKLKVHTIWEKSVENSKTLSDYLSTRGIKFKKLPNLRIYTGTEAELFGNGKRIPVTAMIAKVVDIEGKLATLHITRLANENGRIVRKEKTFFRGLRVKGNVVWFGNIEKTNTIALTEGIETALSIKQSLPNLVVGATLSASLMPQVILPSHITTVYIFGDNDDAGTKAVNKLKERLLNEGLKVSVFFPPKQGTDFNDLLKEQGEQGILNVFMEQKIEKIDDTKFVIPKNFSPRAITNLMIKKFKLFVDKNNTLYCYDPTTGLWITNADNYVKSLIRKYVLAEASKIYYVQEIFKDLKEYLYAYQEFPSAPIELIPFENGVYNIKDESFTPFDDEYHLTFKLPVKFNPSAEAKKISSVLSELVDDPDDLWELVAYTLYRSYPAQKFFILYGQGGNGKGVFTTLLRHMLGSENVSNMSLNDILTNRFATSALFNKLANITEDERVEKIVNDASLKALTGGDRIKAERKNQHPFFFVNYAKIIIQTNILPKAPNTATAGFFRRIFLIEFNKEFEGKSEKRDLVLEILNNPEELQGMANKAIEYLKNLIDKNFRFKNERKTSEMTQIYKKLTNPLETFLEEYTYYTPNKGEFITKELFWKAYNMFLSKHNLGEVSKKELSTRMKQIGHEDTLVRFHDRIVRCWRNLKIGRETLLGLLSSNETPISDRNLEVVNDTYPF